MKAQPTIMGALREPGKGFDKVRHEILFELLEIYLIPEDIIDVIRRLYKNMELKLNSGSAKDTIPYSVVGVKQGDAMAPVLFIMLMQAMAEQRPLKTNNGRQPTSNLSTFIISRTRPCIKDVCMGRPGV
jgi:hypothetical protein